MKARIYSPAKTAMQSGKSKTGNWVLEFEPLEPKRVEPLMGYTSSGDTRSQVRLKFSSLDAAKAYAEKKGLSYTVQQPKEQRRRKISYAENFAYNRQVPWTH